MSAIGIKQTPVIAPHMSAFGGKADIASHAARRSLCAPCPLVCKEAAPIELPQRIVLDETAPSGDEPRSSR